ncbi:hypothetical protein K5X82_04805 [Halosquirtibacter xylanolyticus]|uniref:hypothetical protein n=1 Tax=Halosquirtibacter xylanolyticus TaxID=3374599 RepID=UPI003747B2E8|nr:hypothetical protein K5X82_04805 [Prolixibacteraceae bacterium]
MEPIRDEKVVLFNQSMKLYEDAIKNRSSRALQKFLMDTQPLELLVENQDLYAQLRMARFDAYKLIGEFQYAQREYKAFIATYVDAPVIDWIFKLSDLYFTAFVYSKGAEADKWIEAMGQVVVAYKARSEAAKIDRYQRLALANIHAFYLLNKGDHSSINSLYETFKFQPVEIALCNDPNALPYLYGNMMKGLWCAILLKDKALLTNLLKVISIDDETLYGEKDLFTLFYKTVMDVVDTKSSFKDEFNLFFVKKDWNKNTSDIAYILNSIKGQLTPALKAYFGVF